MSIKKVALRMIHMAMAIAICCHDSTRLLATGNVKSAIIETNSATLRGNSEKKKIPIPSPAPAKRMNSTDSTHQAILVSLLSVGDLVVMR